MVEFVSKIDANADDVYNWYQNFGANDRLTPPWIASKFLRREETKDYSLNYTKTNFGIQVEKTQLDNLKKSITTETTGSNKQTIKRIQSFNNDDNKTIIKESISVNFLKSLIPSNVISNTFKSRFSKEFNFRKHRIENDLKEQAIFKNLPRQNIAILGESSFITNQFKAFFNSANNKVFLFVQRKPYPTAREIQLNTNNGYIGTEKLKYINNIMFFPLAENTQITEENFNEILSYKKLELKMLIEAFKYNKKFPQSFIIMSSTCVYAQDNQSATEKDNKKDNSPIARFYIELEKELEILRLNGCRVIYARLGNIISAQSGYLKNTIKQQKLSFCRYNFEEKNINWVGLDDAIYAVNHMVFNPSMFGEINVCSNFTTNINDLNLLLSQKINRPFLLTMPQIVYDYFNTDYNKQQLLQSNIAKPQRLLHYGYDFKFKTINDILSWETGNFN